MGMRVLIEVEVNYPDLSMYKHVEMLQHVFKQNKVFGVKTVKLISGTDPIKYGEQIYPKLCIWCEDGILHTIDSDNKPVKDECEKCNGTGLDLSFKE